MARDSQERMRIGLWIAAAAAAGVVAAGFLLAEAGAGSPAAGSLTPKGCIDDPDLDEGPDNCAKNADGLDGTSLVAVSSDGKSVYAVSESEAAIVSFKRNRRTGALTPKGCINDPDAVDLAACTKHAAGLSGAGSIAISRDGKSVYVASESDHAIARFKRNRRNGALTAKGCFEDNDSGGGDCTKSANGLAAATSVVVSRDGKSVYAASELDDAVVRFKRNLRNGALTAKGCVDDDDFGTDPNQGEDTCAQSTDGLDQTGALAISDDGKSLYATGEQGTIVRFNRKPNGALTPKGCIDDNDLVAPDDCAKHTNGLETAEGLTVSGDGKSVYVVSGDDDAIVRFDRKRSGALRPKGCIDDNDFGSDPEQGADTCANSTSAMNESTGVAVSADGDWVYVATGEDDAIVRFKRAAGGALTPKGCIDDNDFGTDPLQGEDNCADSANGLAKLTSIAITPDGKSVYAVSENDGAIARFRRATG